MTTLVPEGEYTSYVYGAIKDGRCVSATAAAVAARADASLATHAPMSRPTSYDEAAKVLETVRSPPAARPAALHRNTHTARPGPR